MEILEDEIGAERWLSEELTEALVKMGFNPKRVGNGVAPWRRILLELASRAADQEPLVAALLAERHEAFLELDEARQESRRLKDRALDNDVLRSQLEHAKGDIERLRQRAQEAENTAHDTESELQRYQDVTALERKLGQKILLLAEDGRKLVNIEKDLHLFKKDDSSDQDQDQVLP